VRDDEGGWLSFGEDEQSEDDEQQPEEDEQQPPASQLPPGPPPPPPCCPCFASHPDPTGRRPTHYRIQSPYCPLLPYPEFREEPCVCYATALDPSTMVAHSDVTSPHCPLNGQRRRQRRRRSDHPHRRNASNSEAARARARASAIPCTSCGELGHATNDSSSCSHRISGRIFQPYVQDSPGRLYHEEEAPTMSERCPHCKFAFSTGDYCGQYSCALH
jgi:hypothetical protein